MAAPQVLDINSKLELPSGYSIPILGFGLYLTPPGVAQEVVTHALRAGYRHVDSATMYGNEAEAAAGLLHGHDASGAAIPRHQLFFTSKVLPDDMSYTGAKKSVEETLQKTGLGYIDLYLLHSPFGGKQGRLGAWQALVDSVAEGKVKSIGVSNYGVHHLDELEKYINEIDAKDGRGKGGVLSVNQVELHPWLARSDIIEWCKARGVVLEVGNPESE
jgi:diketogulonate reductase-like aldo/keto reductase